MSINGWKKMCVCIHIYAHTYVYAFIIHNRILPNDKRNEIVPFAATLKDLKIIVLSKVSQKDEYHVTSLMYGI